jgi:poly(3-hydroxybutyrate) depolymerase
MRTKTMKTMRPITLVGVLIFACRLWAAPVPVGVGKLEVPNGTEPITLHTYKPPTYRGGPVLVVFHGVQRNAEDYRNFAITMAERFGVIVVAPHFDAERFPSARYQRGGLVVDGKAQPQDKWTYAIVPKLVAHVRQLEGKPELPYYLIGHSAGGQFLVRMAAFLPGDAVRIVAANPGSLLFPTRDQDFGYGFGGLPAELSSDEIMRRYLAAPLTLYQGTGDIHPSNSFDQSPAGMRQGPNRLARGRAAFEFARRLAQERGWEFNWRKVETPDIGHEAAFMFAAKDVEDALFGPK